MIRLRLLFLKHVFYALIALMVVIAGLELGLRLHDSFSGSSGNVSTGEWGLTVPSGTAHCTLRPLTSRIEHNPDTGAAVRITTNSFGLRGAEPAVPKPNNVFRIVCLGDEQVLAPQIAASETFCVRLQRLLQPRTAFRIEVVNAGIPGYCPLLSFLQVRHSLLSLQADLFILNFDMSDVSDDHRYRRQTRMDGSSTPLACPHADLSTSGSGRHRSFLERLRIVQWSLCQLKRLPLGSVQADDRRDIDIPESRYAWLKDDPPDWSVYIEQALTPIDRLQQTSRQVYARFFLATYPKPWQVSGTASRQARGSFGIPVGNVYRSRKPFDLLAKFAAEHGIEFCDASSAFARAKHPDELYLTKAERFSAHGHQLYARVLAAYILEHVPDIWTGGPESSSPSTRVRQTAVRIR